jgi:hypothetical protein
MELVSLVVVILSSWPWKVSALIPTWWQSRLLTYKKQKICVHYFPEARQMQRENNEFHMHETIYKPIRNRKYVLTIFQRLDRCGEKMMRNTSG